MDPCLTIILCIQPWSTDRINLISSHSYRCFLLFTSQLLHLCGSSCGMKSLLFSALRDKAMNPWLLFALLGLWWVSRFHAPVVMGRGGENDRRRCLCVCEGGCVCVIFFFFFLQRVIVRAVAGEFKIWRCFFSWDWLLRVCFSYLPEICRLGDFGPHCSRNVYELMAWATLNAYY